MNQEAQVGQLLLLLLRKNQNALHAEGCSVLNVLCHGIQVWIVLNWKVCQILRKRNVIWCYSSLPKIMTGNAVHAANILLKDILDAVTWFAGVVTSFVINVDQSGKKTEFPAIALGREQVLLHLQTRECQVLKAILGVHMVCSNSTSIFLFITFCKVARICLGELWNNSLFSGWWRWKM